MQIIKSQQMNLMELKGDGYMLGSSTSPPYKFTLIPPMIGAAGSVKVK